MKQDKEKWKNLFAVIMAGGSGTRFWPLSRIKRPKQLLAITGEKSLLEGTVARLLGMIPLERILIVTNQSQVSETKKILRGLVLGSSLLM